MSEGPAVHTGQNRPTEWYVEHGHNGVYFRLVLGNGRMIEFRMTAEVAHRVSGALRAAAKNYERIEVIRRGEIVGVL